MCTPCGAGSSIGLSVSANISSIHTSSQKRLELASDPEPDHNLFMAVFMAVFLAYKNLAYLPIKYGRKVFLAFLAYIPLTPKYISTPPIPISVGEKGGV